MKIEISVDEVNVALSRLLRLRLLEIEPGRKWRDVTNSGKCSEVEFRRRALIRVREFASADGVKLRRTKTFDLKGMIDDMGNPVMQFQILSKAPEKTATFYSTLFGWTVNADNPNGIQRNKNRNERGNSGRNLACATRGTQLRSALHCRG